MGSFVNIVLRNNTFLAGSLFTINIITIIMMWILLIAGIIFYVIEKKIRKAQGHTPNKEDLGAGPN